MAWRISARVMILLLLVVLFSDYSCFATCALQVRDTSTESSSCHHSTQSSAPAPHILCSLHMSAKSELTVSVFAHSILSCTESMTCVSYAHKNDFVDRLSDNRINNFLDFTNTIALSTLSSFNFPAIQIRYALSCSPPARHTSASAILRI